MKNIGFKDNCIFNNKVWNLDLIRDRIQRRPLLLASSFNTDFGYFVDTPSGYYSRS